jgi:hypothetical protein
MSNPREALLVKSWLSHDARWFNAVAREFGLEAANRLNQAAVREAARNEAQRARRELGLEAPRNAQACAQVLEALVALYSGGAQLLDYETAVDDATGVTFRVHRCFAHDNVTRAGIADRYDCGIFARVAGWLEGLGCEHEIAPAPKGCLKAQGADCVHGVRLRCRAAH